MYFVMKEKQGWFGLECYEINLFDTKKEMIGRCAIDMPTNYLHDFTIFYPHRNKGYGKVFIKELAKVFKFHLYCHNDLVPFYEKCGLTRLPSKPYCHPQFTT